MVISYLVQCDGHCQECGLLNGLIVRFTDTETYTEIFNLHIEITEPDCNVIKFGPQNLEVPEYYGLSNVLDGNIVSFHYEHRHNIECTVHVTTLETHLPAHGQLVTGEPEIQDGPRGDEPDSFVPLRRQLGKTITNECVNRESLSNYLTLPLSTL